MPPKGGKKKAAQAPIFRACEESDIETISELLSALPSMLEQRNADGWTPLICAAFCGELEIVELLIGKGADVSAACKDGDTALHYAAAQGHAEVIKRLALEKGVDFSVTDHDGETAEDVAQGAKIRKLLQQLAAERDGAEGSEPEHGDDEDEAEETTG